MMFSYRLVRLIETHADALAAGLEERVAGSLQVTHFRDISAHELRERVYESTATWASGFWARTNWILSTATARSVRAGHSRRCRSARWCRPSCSPRKISGNFSRAKP